MADTPIEFVTNDISFTADVDYSDNISATTSITDTLIDTIISSASINLNSKVSVVPTKGDLPTFSRNSIATILNNDNNIVSVDNGEICYQGARRVKNLLQYSEDFSNSIWSGMFASISSNVEISPRGDISADKGIEDTTAAEEHAPYRQLFTSNSNTTYMHSVYIKAAERSACMLLAMSGDGLTVYSADFDLVGVTSTTRSNSMAGYSSIEYIEDGWYRCSITFINTVGGSSSYIDLRLSTNPVSSSIVGDLYNGDGTSGIYIWGGVLEDLTGRINKNTISEYVSTNSLDYRSTQDKLYLSLPGVSGNNASTPSTEKNTISGDIDIRVKLSRSTWISGTDVALVGKWGASPNKSYLFLLNSIGYLSWYSSSDGTTNTNNGVLSSIPVSFADNSINIVRVTYNSTTGLINFYTSTDGEVWDQFGTPNIVGTAAPIHRGAAPVEIGSATAGTALLFTGSIYATEIRNGIDGTISTYFDPHADALTPKGTLVSSASGETWTINGSQTAIRNRFYHGAGVDGVKYFDTDIYGNQLNTTVADYTYEYVYLTGAVGSYITTPDSFASSNFEDIDIRAKVSLDKWIPVSNNSIISKWDNASRKSFSFSVDSSGKLSLATSFDGTTTSNTAISSVATGFQNFSTHWVRATFSGITGVFNFYTSDDGDTWDQLGSADIAGVAGVIADTSSIVEIGTILNGTSAYLSGNIYQTQIYNGINGVLVLDFNAADCISTNTTITSSTTGEVYTVQYNAIIQPTNILCSGCFIEQSSDNLLTYSEDFSNAGWSKATGVTISANTTISPAGNFTADKLIEGTTNIRHYIGKGLTIFGEKTYTLSIFAKAAERRYIGVVFGKSGTPWNRAGLIVDLNTGIKTADYTSSTVTGVIRHTPVYYGNGWWRISITLDIDDVYTDGYVEIWPSSNGTLNTYTGNGTYGVYIWGAKVEANNKPTSYIPTSSAIVTKNSDSLTFLTFGNLLSAQGTLSFTFIPQTINNNTYLLDTYYDVNNYTRIYYDGASLIFKRLISGSSYLAKITLPLVVNNTYNIFCSWGTLGTTIYVNGNIGTYSTVIIPTQVSTTMSFGSTRGINYNGTVQNIRIWGSQLPFTVQEYLSANISDTTTVDSNIDSITTYIAGGSYVSTVPIQIDSPGLNLPFDKSDTLDPRFTFTRASSATYIGKDGFIKNANRNLLLYSEEFDNGTWLKTRSSITPNTIEVPYSKNILSEKLIEDNSNNSHYIYQPIAVTANYPYTFSIFVKAAERTNCAITFYNTNGAFTTGTAYFNLSTGTITQLDTLLATIDDAGNGWYRISATQTALATVNGNIALHLVSTGVTSSYLGDSTSGIYICGAKIELSAVPTEYNKNTGSMNGPARFNYDPVNLTSLGILIEEFRTNLALRPQNLTEASWAVSAASVMKVYLRNPKGHVLTDKIVEDSTTALHKVFQVINTTNTAPLTFSVYLKAGERTTATLAIQESSPWTRLSSALFDLNLGTVATPVDNGGATASFATILPAGRGWYRCSITTTLGGAQTQSLHHIHVGTISGHAGDGKSGIYAYSAQVEANETPTSTIPSRDTFTSRASSATYINRNGIISTAATNVPRYTYNPWDLTIEPDLLLESSSSNYVYNGSCGGNQSVASTGTIIGPDGVLCTKVIVNAGSVAYPSSGSGNSSVANGTSVGQTTDYSFSGYLTSYGPKNYQPYIVITASPTPLYALVLFNPSTGLFASKTLNTGWSELVPPKAVMHPCGMWFVTWSVRFTQQASLRTSVHHYLQIYNELNQNTYTADGLSGIQRACNQFEVRSSPSSYITTTTSVGSRSADVSASVSTSRTYDYAVMNEPWFSKFYNQSEGTFVLTSLIPYLDNKVNSFKRLVDINFGNATDSMSISYNNNGNGINRVYFYVFDDAVAQADLQTSSSTGNTSPNTKFRSAFSYKLNDFAASHLGNTVLTDTSGTVPTVNCLVIGSHVNSVQGNANICSLYYYPTKLDNTVLPTLSSSTATNPNGSVEIVSNWSLL